MLTGFAQNVAESAQRGASAVVDQVSVLAVKELGDVGRVTVRDGFNAKLGHH